MKGSTEDSFSEGTSRHEERYRRVDIFMELSDSTWRAKMKYKASDILGAQDTFMYHDTSFEEALEKVKSEIKSIEKKVCCRVKTHFSTLDKGVLFWYYCLE
jgi:hypothetical protein